MKFRGGMWPGFTLFDTTSYVSTREYCCVSSALWCGPDFSLGALIPVRVAEPPRFRKCSLRGDCIPDRDLFRVYRDFGLHQMSPRSLVPQTTCGDDVFARGRLYNNTEKDYPHPVG